MKDILKIAANKGINECEVFYRELINNEIIFENNNLKNISSTQNSGIGIRGIINNKMGLCSVSKESDAESALTMLAQSAEFSEPKEYDFASPGQYNYPKIYDVDTKDISIENLVKDGEKVIDEVGQYDKNILVNVTFENELDTIKVANSLGIDNEYKKSSFVALIDGQIIDDTNFIETNCYKYGIDKRYNLDVLINTFIERIKLARQSTTFSSGKTKVMFTPNAFGDIMITVLQGVNGNTVEKGISPLLNRLGEKIFDQRFTLIDDGTVDKYLGSKPFDDEGTPTRKNLIIENGVLKSYIHSLKTAARTKSTPTGNGNRSSYSSSPSPSINNLIINPGEKTFEELLESMDSGIIIDEIMGLDMNNILNGDFGGNISLGYKVEKGKIIGRVKNCVFNSNIYKILKDDLLGISNLNYTNPVVKNVFSEKAQPCALFKDINVTIK